VVSHLHATPFQPKNIPRQFYVQFNFDCVNNFINS
jgi:hypothetical protein